MYSRLAKHYTLPIILSLGFILLLQIANFFPQVNSDTTFLKTQINVYGVQSSKFQMLSYVIFLTVLGIITLKNFNILRSHSEPSKKNSRRKFLIILALGVTVLLLSIGLIQFLLVLMAASVATICSIIFRKSEFPRLLVRPFSSEVTQALIIVIYVVAFFIAPILFDLITPRIDDVYNFQSHYAATVLPGDEWFNGRAPIRFNYGYWLTLGTFLGHHLFSLFGFPGVDLRYIVQFYQLTSVVLMLVLLRSINRRIFYIVATVLLVLITPFFNSAAIWTPNQTGIRYFPFILSTAFLYIMSKKKIRRVQYFSLGISLLIIGSPEIGIVVGGGCIIYLSLIQDKLENFLTSLANISTKITLSCCLYILIFGSFLKVTTGIDVLAGLFEFIKQFGSGYGAITNKPHLLVCVLIILSTVTLTNSIKSRSCKEDVFTNAFEGAVSIMILMWLPYYLNRMVPSNAWFEYFLSAVLVSSLQKRYWHTEYIQALKKYYERYFVKFISISLSLIFLISTFNDSRPLFEYYRSQIVGNLKCNPPFVQVTGVCVTGNESRLAGDQLEYLDTITKRSNYLVLSRFATESRRMGFNIDFPWYDTITELITINDFNDVVKWLDNEGPSYLLIDIGSSFSTYGENLKLMNLEIANSLGPYHFLKSEHGWATYER
jgi:hypothetical protein